MGVGIQSRHAKRGRVCVFQASKSAACPWEADGLSFKGAKWEACLKRKVGWVINQQYDRFRGRGGGGIGKSKLDSKNPISQGSE